MTIAEDFLLLAMRAEDGRPLVSIIRLQCGLTGAVLADLALAGRITLDGAAVTVSDPTPVGTPDEDAALDRIAAEQPHDLHWWLMDLRRDLQERIIARLVTRGALGEKRQRTMGIFSQTIHPSADPALERQALARLTSLIDGAPPEPESLLLLAIVHATGLDEVIFPQVEAGAIEARLAEQADLSELVQQIVTTLPKTATLLTIAALAGT